ncbi:ABC transporter ATP-binding protein [Acetobacter musti]|uniref:ABC transporter ATP-binding protein n=2 Tax=Acetobacter musti TaxID=864732 RepID=A0ABX0JLR5_9PROT|nr:ABC transporter ATP-binding protein [Acetobacter musti]NHN84353.1 ABC transporter ATP-binding protein [Acetobacter musti]
MLELANATPFFEDSGLPPVPLNLRLMPGECMIVETRDMLRATMFADLCSGLLPLNNGTVKVCGLDWATLDNRRSNALRGRIGRITRRASWTSLFGTHVELMLRELHHTTRSIEEITSETLRLSEHFGLPGIPVDAARYLSFTDQARANCVRAFLGSPDLLLLEDPLDGGMVDLSVPFLESLTAARDRGAAALWFVRDASTWQPYRETVSAQWRLADDGLITVRMR